MASPVSRGHLAVAEPAPLVGERVPTVGEYLEEWLWGKQSLRPSTHLSYESHVRRFFIPFLGNLPLDDLRPGQRDFSSA